MKKRYTIIACCLFFAVFCFGQEENVKDTTIVADSISLDTESTVIDSNLTEKKKKSGPIRNFLRKDYPNPKKAMIFSLVIPGAGQLYNKKYWKAPIVYGAYATMIYLIDFSTSQYKYLKQEYIYCVDDDGSTVSELKINKGWGEDDIKQFRDIYRKRMELSYIGLVAVAVLSGIDAYVDAHLMGFDVSEDLTLKVLPKINFIPFEGSSLGLGFSFHLNSTNQFNPQLFFNEN